MPLHLYSLCNRYKVGILKADGCSRRYSNGKARTPHCDTAKIPTDIFYLPGSAMHML